MTDKRSIPNFMRKRSPATRAGSAGELQHWETTRREKTQTARLADLAGRGDERATNELFAMLYVELRALAAGFLAHERAGHTLQTTALLHEAYLRLVAGAPISWEGRAHFFGAAARAIRRVLIDHARARAAEKRGGSGGRVPLRDLVGPGGPDVDVLALEEALVELAEVDERMARAVELRFFGGLSVAETAEILGISEGTLARDWQFARAWLHARLKEADRVAP